LPDVPHGDGVNDALLVGEEAVERADRQSGLGGDAGSGDLFQRHLLQQGTGGVEDALYGLMAAALDRQAPRRSGNFSCDLSCCVLAAKSHRSETYLLGRSQNLHRMIEPRSGEPLGRSSPAIAFALT